MVARTRNLFVVAVPSSGQSATSSLMVYSLSSSLAVLLLSWLLRLLLEDKASLEENELLLSEEEVPAFSEDVSELLTSEADVSFLQEPNVNKDNNAKKETNFDLMIV